jgi:cell division septum initiation protein DivIVA
MPSKPCFEVLGSYLAEVDDSDVQEFLDTVMTNWHRVQIENEELRRENTKLTEQLQFLGRVTYAVR